VAPGGTDPSQAQELPQDEDLVAYKRVVDYNVRIQVKPDGSGVVTEGVKLAQSVRRNRAGRSAAPARQGHRHRSRGRHHRPADAQAHLRNGLAMGANRAIHVVTDQPSSR
jgi:electron transfer flavoprotein beta subunit